ncbi:MAG TPA: hypothetical protein VFE61_21460 [Candidatus Sulfotelmatobacter sp.]|nr:hypothetical protein [Candidatus Sulfotelmatobacter sp.]
MGWDVLADANGFLLICPIASWKPGGKNGGIFFRQAYNTSSYFPSVPDDSGFLRRLILVMEGSPSLGGFSVDPKRVFVMGMSSGGLRTHRMCRDNADIVAACAPLSGTVWIGVPTPKLPSPRRSASIIEFHGDADPTISYCGGLFWGWQEGGIPYPSVDVDLNYWLAADGLGPNTTPPCSNGQPSKGSKLDFKSSDGKTEVQFVRELSSAHTYKQWAIAAAWEFFSTHGR